MTIKKQQCACLKMELQQGTTPTGPGWEGARIKKCFPNLTFNVLYWCHGFGLDERSSSIQNARLAPASQTASDSSPMYESVIVGW